MDLPNVQNIQVLKGPQSTLFGRNATGGAILLDTMDPSKEWTGNIEATYGKYNDRRARGFVAGPLSDRIGISRSPNASSCACESQISLTLRSPSLPKQMW